MEPVRERRRVWGRRLFLIAVVTVSVGVLGAGFVAWCFVFGQQLSVVHAADGALIDVKSLGEYQANVRRFRIAESASRKVIWELQAENGTFPLWTVPLRVGDNPALPEAIRGAEVVTPMGDRFVLVAGTEYRVDLWTSKDWNVPRHVKTSFVLP